MDVQFLLSLGSWFFGILGLIMVVPGFMSIMIIGNGFKKGQEIILTVLVLTLFSFSSLCFICVFLGRYIFNQFDKMYGLYILYFPSASIILIIFIFSYIYYLDQLDLKEYEILKHKINAKIKESIKNEEIS